MGGEGIWLCHSLQQPKNFRHAGDRRFWIEATQSDHFRCFFKGKAGVERAKTAEDVTRTQWRNATKKMHGRERQGERRRMRKKRTRQEKNEKIEERIRSSQRMAFQICFQMSHRYRFHRNILRLRQNVLLKRRTSSSKSTWKKFCFWFLNIIAHPVCEKCWGILTGGQLESTLLIAGAFTLNLFAQSVFATAFAKSGIDVVLRVGIVISAANPSTPRLVTTHDFGLSRLPELICTLKCVVLSFSRDALVLKWLVNHIMTVMPGQRVVTLRCGCPHPSGAVHVETEPPHNKLQDGASILPKNSRTGHVACHFTPFSPTNGRPKESLSTHKLESHSNYPQVRGIQEAVARSPPRTAHRVITAFWCNHWELLLADHSQTGFHHLALAVPLHSWPEQHCADHRTRPSVCEQRSASPDRWRRRPLPRAPANPVRVWAWDRRPALPSIPLEIHQVLRDNLLRMRQDSRPSSRPCAPRLVTNPLPILRGRISSSSSNRGRRWNCTVDRGIHRAHMKLLCSSSFVCPSNHSSCCRVVGENHHFHLKKELTYLQCTSGYSKYFKELRLPLLTPVTCCVQVLVSRSALPKKRCTAEEMQTLVSKGALPKTRCTAWRRDASARFKECSWKKREALYPLNVCRVRWTPSLHLWRPRSSMVVVAQETARRSLACPQTTWRFVWAGPDAGLRARQPWHATTRWKLVVGSVRCVVEKGVCGAPVRASILFIKLYQMDFPPVRVLQDFSSKPLRSWRPASRSWVNVLHWQIETCSARQCPEQSQFLESTTMGSGADVCPRNSLVNMWLVKP